MQTATSEFLSVSSLLASGLDLSAALVRFHAASAKLLLLCSHTPLCPRSAEHGGEVSTFPELCKMGRFISIKNIRKTSATFKEPRWAYSQKEILSAQPKQDVTACHLVYSNRQTWASSVPDQIKWVWGPQVLRWWLSTRLWMRFHELQPAQMTGWHFSSTTFSYN